MPKSLSSRIWSSLISKILLLAVAFGFFYVIADPFGFVPEAVKALVAFVGANLQLWVFLFCFTFGGYIVLVIFKSRNKSGSSNQ